MFLEVGTDDISHKWTMQNFSYVRCVLRVLSHGVLLFLLCKSIQEIYENEQGAWQIKWGRHYIYIHTHTHTHWKRGERPVTMRVTLFLPGMSGAPKEWKACMNHSLCYVLALLCHKILLTVKISNNEIKLNAQIFSMKFFFFFLFCSVHHRTPTSIVRAW
jgi:hypothetical protein